MNMKFVAFLLLATSGIVTAQELPPTASTVCAEARANLLRARLKYVQHPMRDRAVIHNIFHARMNDYHAELRPATEAEKRYPDIWLESFYALNQPEIMENSRLAYSVGDSINVQGNIIGIEFVEYSRIDDVPQRPACKITVSVDWDQAGAR